MHPSRLNSKAYRLMNKTNQFIVKARDVNFMEDKPKTYNPAIITIGNDNEEVQPENQQFFPIVNFCLFQQEPQSRYRIKSKTPISISTQNGSDDEFSIISGSYQK